MSRLFRPYSTPAGADSVSCECSGAHSYTAEVRGGFVRVCRWGSAAAPSEMRVHGHGGDGVRTVTKLIDA